MDWAGFVFGGRGEEYELLRRTAEQRFWFDPTLAEEAFTAAMEALDADGWARLGRFDQRSSPRTFLVSAFQNCLEDFARRIYGRVRPPKWICDLGGPWLDAHEWLCLQRIEPREVVARLFASGRVASQADAQAMVRAIRAGLPRCGQGTGPIRLQSTESEDFDPLELRAAAGGPVAADPTECSENDTLEAALLAIATLLGTASLGQDNRLHALGRLELADEEVVMLRLIYVEEESVAGCARLLGEAEHNVRRRLRRLHERIATILTEAGLDSNGAISER